MIDTMLREVKRDKTNGCVNDLALATRTARALKHEGRFAEVGSRLFPHVLGM